MAPPLTKEPLETTAPPPPPPPPPTDRLIQEGNIIWKPNKCLGTICTCNVTSHCELLVSQYMRSTNRESVSAVNHNVANPFYNIK